VNVSRARAIGRIGVLAAAIASCGGDRGSSSTPEGAVRALVDAARAADRGGVYRLLGPATRARLEAHAAAARRISGRVPLAPADFLSVGWAPPAWEPFGMRLVARDDGHAQVEVSSAAGDRFEVQLVRDDGQWRIELPGG
jgi:hypothetical protein